MAPTKSVRTEHQALCAWLQLFVADPVDHTASQVRGTLRTKTHSTGTVRAI
jgi:hypothetical protein